MLVNYVHQVGTEIQGGSASAITLIRLSRIITIQQEFLLYLLFMPAKALMRMPQLTDLTASTTY